MASKGMSFYWGNYVHPAGEVFPLGVESIPMYNSRGQRWARDVRLHVGGDLVPNGETPLSPGTIAARVLELEQAYMYDYQDCGFLMNGIETPHRLYNDDTYNLSGNQVISLKWENVFPTEFQNTRSFKIVIRAIFLDSYTNVLEFNETVRKVGTGDPVWKLYDSVDGPEKVEVLDKSKVFHVQQGFVVGAISRLNPPPPLWPLEEHRDRRIITSHSGKFFGNPRVRPANRFRTDYTYFFERLGSDPILPNNWYPS